MLFGLDFLGLGLYSEGIVTNTKQAIAAVRHKLASATSPTTTVLCTKTPKVAMHTRHMHFQMDFGALGRMSPSIFRSWDPAQNEMPGYCATPPMCQCLPKYKQRLKPTAASHVQPNHAV